MHRWNHTVTFAFLITAVILSGCSKIQPDPVSISETSTHNSVTTLEYSLYVGKEVNVFLNQIVSQMEQIKYGEEECCAILSGSITESIHLMQEAYDELSMTHAPDTDLEEKKAIMSAMDLSLSHMKDYRDAVETNGDTNAYIYLLHNDFYVLSANTSTYTQ